MVHFAGEEFKFSEKEQKHQTNIAKVQQMIANAASASALKIHFKASNITSLESKLKDRVADVACLSDKLQKSKIALRESDQKNFAHIKDSARLSKRHEVETETLKKELADSLMKHEIDVTALNATITEGQQQMSSLLD